MSSICLDICDETPLAIRRNLTTLGEIVSTTTASAAKFLSETKLALNQEIDEPSRLLFVDKDRISEILCILVVYIAKQCSDEGEIKLNTFVGEAGHTEFCVSSETDSIAADARRHILNVKSTKVSETDDTTTESCLVRAKRIIELHEGEIWANLGPGRGTEIGFYLSS